MSLYHHLKVVITTITTTIIIIIIVSIIFTVVIDGKPIDRNGCESWSVDVCFERIAEWIAEIDDTIDLLSTTSVGVTKNVIGAANLPQLPLDGCIAGISIQLLVCQNGFGRQNFGTRCKV